MTTINALYFISFLPFVIQYEWILSFSIYIFYLFNFFLLLLIFQSRVCMQYWIWVQICGYEMFCVQRKSINVFDCNILFCYLVWEPKIYPFVFWLCEENVTWLNNFLSINNDIIIFVVFSPSQYSCRTRAIVIFYCMHKIRYEYERHFGFIFCTI